VQYPKELLGLWIAGAQPCSEQGASYDGDLVMRITSGALQGYEDRSKPARVEAIPSQLMA
jgi:hypothetical protein